MNWPIVKRGWIKVSTIRPDECLHLRVNTHPIKKYFIYQWSKQLALKNWSKIDDLSRCIVEPDPDSIVANNLE